MSKHEGKICYEGSVVCCGLLYKAIKLYRKIVDCIIKKIFTDDKILYTLCFTFTSSSNYLEVGLDPRTINMSKTHQQSYLFTWTPTDRDMASEVSLIITVQFIKEIAQEDR